MPWAFSGFTADEIASGLIVNSVLPGMFADRVGLRPGDRLVTFGGAPILTQWCVQALPRMLNTGDKVQASWVRDGARHYTKGRLRRSSSMNNRRSLCTNSMKLLEHVGEQRSGLCRPGHIQGGTAHFCSVVRGFPHFLRLRYSCSKLSVPGRLLEKVIYSTLYCIASTSNNGLMVTLQAEMSSC